MIVSAETSANPLQWNSIDNLVTSSNAVVDIFDRGIKRVSGVSELAGTGGISQDGYLTTVHMDLETAMAYNAAAQEVLAESFTKSAEQYLAEQSEIASTNFSAAVDQYVNAASIFVEVTRVSQLAADAQTTGDATRAQAVQSYISDNNVLISEQNVTDYNNALDSVELTGETWATVEAVYQNGEAVAALQAQADSLGYDFANASDMTLDRFSEFTESASITFSSGSIESMILFVDVSMNLKTIEEMNQAGNGGSFYQTGPTQNACFFEPESPECAG